MKEIFFKTLEDQVSDFLSYDQKIRVKEILIDFFKDKSIIYSRNINEPNNIEIIQSFLSAKNIEGCSKKTIKYYEIILNTFMDQIDKLYKEINTDDIRSYLDKYQQKNNASRTTVDNVRRIISSFFSWLEDEDFIIKSPVRRIKKIKSGKKVKETYSDETIEFLRQKTTNIRDLAIIDFLTSTGVRVGELVNLNVQDIDFNNRECVVKGKGNNERKVYFDARTKINLQKYLDSRDDENPSLFVSIFKPYDKLEISGVEIVLKKIGRKIGLNNVHPHKFRRTLATRAIDKGMPIEQVQRMLGHAKIDTTLEYAMVDDSNVKISHKKYLER